MEVGEAGVPRGLNYWRQYVARWDELERTEEKLGYISSALMISLLLRIPVPERKRVLTVNYTQYDITQFHRTKVISRGLITPECNIKPTIGL